MRFRVADWLVHGGHQYEFFKSKHVFLCTNPNGSIPRASDLGRPKNSNVKYMAKRELLRSSFDIVMVRAGVDYSKYLKKIIHNKIPGIAVMQTYLPYNVPSWVRCVVWNSETVMRQYMKQFPRQKHFYIPHGFDPRQFSYLKLERMPKILSAAALFRQRKKVMGYDEWRWVSDVSGICDLLGHGNDDMPESIGSVPLQELVRTYNQYSVFLNTTTKSAMPRVRGEALMCGTPIVTTKNFGIEKYLKHKVHCYYADTKYDMLKYSKEIISSKSMQEDLSLRGREAAKKFFHINDYLVKWQEVFEEAVR